MSCWNDPTSWERERERDPSCCHPLSPSHNMQVPSDSCSLLLSLSLYLSSISLIFLSMPSLHSRYLLDREASLSLSFTLLLSFSPSFYRFPLPLPRFSPSFLGFLQEKSLKSYETFSILLQFIGSSLSIFPSFPLSSSFFFPFSFSFSVSSMSLFPSIGPPHPHFTTSGGFLLSSLFSLLSPPLSILRFHCVSQYIVIHTND